MADKYNVERSRLAEAYDTWCREIGQAKGQHRHVLFITRLKGKLRMLNAGDDTQPLGENREYWRSCRNASPGASVPIRKELCIAIKTLTGEDVTPNQALSNEHNHTELVTLVGTPNGRRVSNEPDAEGAEAFDVSIDRIAFRKSSVMRVLRGWLPGEADSNETDLGSVTLGLREAQIVLEAQGGVVPRITSLVPNGDGVQRAERVSFSDDPRHPGKWTIRPDRDLLEGSVYLPSLATAKITPDSDMRITVSADEAAIEADFRITGEVEQQDRTKTQARKHIMDKILMLDMTTEGRALTLCRAKVEVR